MKTYSEKLRDPRWQKMRLKVMERDGFTCQICFDDKSTLNVHHALYMKGHEPWEYDLGLLVTTCETCHASIELFKKEIAKAMTDDIGVEAVYRFILAFIREPLKTINALRDIYDVSTEEIRIRVEQRSKSK